MKLTEQNRKGPWVFHWTFLSLFETVSYRGGILLLLKDSDLAVFNEFGTSPQYLRTKNRPFCCRVEFVCVHVMCQVHGVRYDFKMHEKIDQFIRDMWGLEYLRWSNKVTGNLPNLKVIGYPHIQKNKINIYISSHFDVWLTVLLLQKSLLTLMNEWSSKSFGSPGKLILNTSLLEGQWFLYLVL